MDRLDYTELRLLSALRKVRQRSPHQLLLPIAPFVGPSDVEGLQHIAEQGRCTERPLRFAVSMLRLSSNARSVVESHLPGGGR